MSIFIMTVSASVIASRAVAAAASGDSDDWLWELAPARLQPITDAAAAGAGNVVTETRRPSIITQHLPGRRVDLQRTVGLLLHC